MRAYSNDLRQRVVAAYDAREGTQEQVAARFAVSASWVRKLLRRRRAIGSIAPTPPGGGPPPAPGAGPPPLRRRRLLGPHAPPPAARHRLDRPQAAWRRSPPGLRRRGR